jgi:outer membrane protein assembly factor BamA
VAYSPETSWEFGISGLYVYYARRDTTNRLSEINGFTFYTLERQYGAWLDHALYTHGNKWSFLGRVKYQNMRLLYYGIGPHTDKEPLASVDAHQLNIKERALRKVGRNFFAGPEIDYQRMASVHFEPHKGNVVIPPAGSEGSSNLGIGGGILYDNRHNVLNVRKGGFAELAVLRYSKALGSTYTFTSIISDNRVYKPVNKRDVLAAQLFGQFTAGAPPFNQLALLGGESLMRGYYTGRFRDRNQIAAQVEYRMLPLPFGFTRRWGAAVFGGTGTVFDSFKNLGDSKIVWAGGAGLRFLIFPKKDIFSRLDFAFTKEGSGIYIFIGEAF